MRFKNIGSSNQLADIVTALQSTPFRINDSMLEFLNRNRDMLISVGLLMPSFLATVDPVRSCEARNQVYIV